MLLAEALAAHKDHVSAINAMPARMAAAALCFEDATDSERAEGRRELAELEASFAGHLAEAERLVVAINRTNNATMVKFEGRELSIMEAVALRDRLTSEEKRTRELLESVEEAVSGRSGRSWRGLERRTKDDIRRVALFNIGERRAAHDTLARRIRGLDMELQQRNWAITLIES